MPSHAPDHDTQGSGVAGAAAVDAARTRRLAAAAWAEMAALGVLPTPRAYELWFAYRGGASVALTRHVAQLIGRGGALTPAALDAAHAEFVANAELDVDEIGAGCEAIQDEARALVEQVAGGQAALRRYGAALEHWFRELGNEPSLGVLVGAIATLTAETARASERNRTLEQQIAESSGRISRLRHSLAEVKQEAKTDALTGLCNRRAFNARIKRGLLRVNTEPASPACLLMVDVDHFKRFNDTYGHHTGDLVLRLVARLLADNVKGRDTVARYGGEEFAILLAGADLTAATAVARQLGTALGGKRLVNKGTADGYGQVTASIGVAQARPGESAASLVGRADQALYEAKRTGRNRVCTELDLGAGVA